MVKSRRLRIEPEIAPEMHDGMAPIGFHILAQGRDFERFAVDDHGDRAVLDPGRNRLEPGLLRPLHDRIGQHGGGAVDLRDGPPEQRIAHGAAHDARLLAPAVIDLQEAAQGRTVEKACQSLSVEGFHHSKCPGTTRPFSTWVGT